MERCTIVVGGSWEEAVMEPGEVGEVGWGR